IFWSYEVGKEQVMNNLKSANEEIARQNAEIMSMNTALEEKVSQRTLRLATANEELDTFLYESSHALRRPLVRIMGLLQLMELEYPPEERDGFKSIIRMTTTEMDRMLHDLLKVSEVNNRDLEFRPVLLQDEVDSVVGDLEIRIDMSAVDLHIDIPEDFEPNTDNALLRILLDKLIQNAVKYRSPERPRHTVRIAARHDVDHHVLEVYDTGMGIDPRAMPDLFKMFVRGTEKYNGNGLGLFIVQKVLERIQADIEVNSKMGEYTRMTVRFPKKPAKDVRMEVVA
ncbi:MAG: HAMP domain-containing sensor histidine kinase, partial [Bacteroidota bacterium]